MSRRISYYFDVAIVAVLFAFLFIVIGLFLVGNGINFKKEIGFSEIFNSLIAILLAVFIPNSVGKILENKKGGKNMVISDCDCLINNLKELSIYIESICFQKKNILSTKNNKDNISNIILLRIKEIGNQVKIVEEGIKTFADETDFIEKYTDFRTNTTETIKDKNFSFDSNYYTLFFKEYLNFKKEISGLKYKINKI